VTSNNEFTPPGFSATIKSSPETCSVPVELSFVVGERFKVPMKIAVFIPVSVNSKLISSKEFSTVVSDLKSTKILSIAFASAFDVPPISV